MGTRAKRWGHLLAGLGLLLLTLGSGCSADVSVGCVSDLDCAPGDFCDLDGVCVQVIGYACASDLDCPPEAYCDVDGFCSVACLTDVDCPADSVCSADGVCVY